MKTKLILFSILFSIIISFTSFAQSDYYYSRGVPIYLDINTSQVNITTSNQFDETSLNTLGVKPFTMQTETRIRNGEYKKWAKLEFQDKPTTQTEYEQKVNELKSVVDVEGVYPYFDTQGDPIGTSNYFHVKLLQLADTTLLKSIALDKQVDIDHQGQYMPLWYTLSCNENTAENSFELSKYFYETGLFETVDPAFFYDITIEPETPENINIVTPENYCNDEPMFDQQWNLYSEEHPEADINACEAWEYATGLNITVAVQDTGIDHAHEDLFVTDYTLTSPNDPLAGDYYYQMSQYFIDHGTKSAGIIAAKHNGVGIAGIAPDVTLLNVANRLGTPLQSEYIANGINWAVNDKNADVINMSFGNPSEPPESDLIKWAIDNALDLGTVIVCAAGNGGGAISFPANYRDEILCVSSSTSLGEYGNDNFGVELDVVAPKNYLSTIISGYGIAKHTSSSAPNATGIVALMLSAKPCLSNKHVVNIIERTANKNRPDLYLYDWTYDRYENGKWHEKMGYGIVDAHLAVATADAIDDLNLDLYMRDQITDFGLEPPENVTKHANFVLWNSPDIWCRNYQDGFYYQEHQNPEYDINDPENKSYINVRITNKSCTEYVSGASLKVYWSKLADTNSWPDLWTGLWDDIWGIEVGNLVGTMNIPALEPGEQVILEFEWDVPNPEDYIGIIPYNDPEEFSFLARIVSNVDPMAVEETYPNTGIGNVWVNTYNNNNIAWKNVRIVEPATINSLVNSVTISNLEEVPHENTLEFCIEESEKGKPIFEEAEVTLCLDSELYQNWANNGAVFSNSEQKNNQKFLVLANHATFDNITLEANEIRSISLNFNFLTDELTNKNDFYYHFVQRDKNTQDIISGKTFYVKKHNQNTFDANAGDDKEIDKTESVTLTAQEINEPATYNWYDPEGNLIYTGIDVTVSPDITKQYQLEIIKDSDGFKDYDDVNVVVYPFVLGNITPNPANDTVTIDYISDIADSAYLILTEVNTNSSHNHILNIVETSVMIDVSNYTSGLYFVSLICDGLQIDNKTLIIN